MTSAVESHQRKKRKKNSGTFLRAAVSKSKRAFCPVMIKTQRRRCENSQTALSLFTSSFSSLFMRRDIFQQSLQKGDSASSTLTLHTRITVWTQTQTFKCFFREGVFLDGFLAHFRTRHILVVFDFRFNLSFQDVGYQPIISTNSSESGGSCSQSQQARVE